jgi:hypothetical protein
MLDAVAAALAALNGQRIRPAKRRDGRIEALRVLRATRRTAVKARRAALQQLRNAIVAAPDKTRDRLRGRSRMQLIRGLAASRPNPLAFRDPETATQIALRSLARRILELTDEIADLDELITPLVTELAPQMLERVGFGVEVTGQLLISAGDNPDRLASEAAWAMLCGSAPLPASSEDPTPPAQPRRRPRPPTAPSAWPPSAAYASTRAPRPTPPAAKPTASPNAKPCAASSATSPARPTTSSLDEHESVSETAIHQPRLGKTLRDGGILPSNGRRGDAFDNALAESFSATSRPS